MKKKSLLVIFACRLAVTLNFDIQPGEDDLELPF